MISDTTSTTVTYRTDGRCVYVIDLRGQDTRPTPAIDDAVLVGWAQQVAEVARLISPEPHVPDAPMPAAHHVDLRSPRESARFGFHDAPRRPCYRGSRTR